MTEREILDLIRSRNQDGLSELLKHYRPMISYIIAPILLNREDQEECVSEVILKVWDNKLYRIKKKIRKQMGGWENE